MRRKPGFSAENPIDAGSIRKHQWHADDRDNQHDAKRLPAGGRIVNSQAILGIWIGKRSCRDNNSTQRSP